ncbi:hypothetical protein LUZ60_006306 [Juncus effusus]|nr:hypothetical protein LUZ60_006306 [Juncus effusus]
MASRVTEKEEEEYMEDLQRALSGDGLTVSSVSSKGRALFTTRSFSPGEVILYQDPYASVPNKASVGSICDYCFSSSNVKKCTACRVACYCSIKCQRAEWKLHQLECKALNSLSEERKKMVTPTIRLIVRLSIRAKLQQDKIIPASEKDNYDLIKALESHISALGEDQLVLYAQMANLVNLMLPNFQIDLKEITHNFSKLACNAHTICDAELRPIGTGLFPVISMINHSCVPNSVLVFEGRVAYVRAIEPISKNTEVVISYIETYASYERRQNELKQYYFTCTCPRCIKNNYEEDSVLEGYRCKNNKCNGILVNNSEKGDFICEKCGLNRDELELKRINDDVVQLCDNASVILSKGNINEAYLLYKKIEEIQSNIYQLFSVNLLRTHETLLKICMELKDWEAALMYCKLTIQAYERIYPPIHPMIGLQFYTCAKIEWLLEKTEEALKSYTRAFDILRITHGTKSHFMKELIFNLDEARAEASYKNSSLERD